ASAPTAVQTAALNAVDKLHIASAADTIHAVVLDESQPEANRIAALSALEKINDPRLAEAVKVASASSVPRLRLAALPIAARLSPEAAAPAIAAFVAQGTTEGPKNPLEILGLK